MKNFTRYRSLLARGAAVFAISFLLLAWTGCKQSKDTDSKVEQPTTMEEYTECTTTTTTSTGTTSTTSSTTTSTETTTAVTMTTAEQTTQKIVSESIQATEPVQTWASEDDVVLLAKLINHEASATYDGKVMVGSCVVNRMNIKGMRVSEVIFEPNQFTTAYSLTTYTDADYQAAQQVLTQGSADTRIYYFNGCHPDCKNWFYDINYNYLGAW